jgi:peptide chain release factor subunit 1
LTSIRAAIKDMKKMPVNGLAIFGGAGYLEIVDPPIPLRRNIYRCDSRFHVEPIIETIQSIGEPVGIICLNGDGLLLGIANGSRREIKHKYSVSLPQKHGRGGQSALRFSRLADEARHNYIMRCVELCCSNYLVEGIPTVIGLVFVGNGDLKTKCIENLPDCLRSKVLAVEDLAYGGEIGFHRACVLAETKMSSALLQEQRDELQKLETEIQIDRGLYLLGKEDVLLAIEAGAVQKLLLESKKEETLERLARESGASILRISDQTPEGKRFCQGMTGVAAFLRWVYQPIQRIELIAESQQEDNVDNQRSPDFDNVDFM